MGFYLNTMAVFSPKAAAKKSFNVFSTPIAPKLKEHQQEYLAQAEQFEIDFENKKIRAYKWGKGAKDLYFFHGWQSHSFRWKPYIDEFSLDEYTIYAVDGPAHGNSEGKLFNIPLYQRLIIQLLSPSKKPYGIIGHSLGGFASLYAVFEREDLSPEKLILMGAPVLVNDFVIKFQETLGLTDRVINAMIDYFKETLGNGPEYYDSTEFVKTLKSKGLLIHDVEDDTVPVTEARRVAKNWPNVEYWETNGYGHRLRDPEVVKRVLAFISES